MLSLPSPVFTYRRPFKEQIWLLGWHGILKHRDKVHDMIHLLIIRTQKAFPTSHSLHTFGYGPECHFYIAVQMTLMCRGNVAQPHHLGTAFRPDT